MNNLGPEADAEITWTKKLWAPAAGPGKGAARAGGRGPSTQASRSILPLLALRPVHRAIREQPPRPAKQVWDAACTRVKYMSTGCGQDVVRTVEETGRTEPAHAEGREDLDTQQG